VRNKSFVKKTKNKTYPMKKMKLDYNTTSVCKVIIIYFI